MPAEAGFALQSRCAPDGPPTSDSVTEPETGLPPESVNVTWGWGASGAPPVPLPGGWVKASEAAPLLETTNGALVPWIEPPLIVAVSV